MYLANISTTPNAFDKNNYISQTEKNGQDEKPVRLCGEQIKDSSSALPVNDFSSEKLPSD